MLYKPVRAKFPQFQREHFRPTVELGVFLPDRRSGPPPKCGHGDDIDCPLATIVATGFPNEGPQDHYHRVQSL